MAVIVAIVFACCVEPVLGHGQHPDTTGQVQCPGSPASTHAWLVVELTASASCSDVRSEMLARVAGQDAGTWRDPHDGGGGKQKYTLLEESGTHVLFSRLSSNGLYTDKQLITFAELGSGSCAVAGCSESQGASGGDQSTNYCNLRNLYCGSAENCCPMHTDFAWEETSITKSSGATSNTDVCLGGKGGSGGGWGGEEQSSCLTTFVAGTKDPTADPSQAPTVALTESPTNAPSDSPTQTPTLCPTIATSSPTMPPTIAGQTYAPTQMPTALPTPAPTIAPTTMAPTTATPTVLPTVLPTVVPTHAFTDAPTQTPPPVAGSPMEAHNSTVQSTSTRHANLQGPSDDASRSSSSVAYLFVSMYFLHNAVSKR